MKRKSQKRKQFLTLEIILQRRWIERCENNGKSYADGQRGQDIKIADLDYLIALEAELKEYA
jgi:hypothetical protein